MNAAGPGKTGRPFHVAPPVRGLGPLARSLEVTDALGSGDRHAVDKRGRERVELTGKRRRRCLVEQCQAGIELTAVDEAGAVNDECERLQVGITEPLGDLERALRLGDRLVELAENQHGLLCAHQRRLTVLERLRPRPRGVRSPLASQPPASGRFALIR